MKQSDIVTLGVFCFMAIIIALADTDKLGPIRSAYAFPNGDKVGHASLYGGLSLTRGLIVSRGQQAARLYTTVLASSAAIGLVVVFEECSQLFLQSRSADLRDALAGYAGIGLATVGVIGFRRATAIPR